MDSPKYCSYHHLISQSIEDCFVLKGKIQDLIDSASIYLLEDSIKAPVNQVSITEDALEASESREPEDEKEVWEAEEDWTVYKIKSAKKHRERTAVGVKGAERKPIRAMRKESKFFRVEAKKKTKTARKRSSKRHTDQRQLVQQPPAPTTLEEYVPRECSKY